MIILSVLLLHFVRNTQAFGCISCFDEDSTGPGNGNGERSLPGPGDRIELELIDFNIDNLECNQFSHMGDRATLTTTNIWNLNDFRDNQYFGARIASLSGFCVCIDYIDEVLDCQKTVRINNEVLGSGAITMRGPMSLRKSKWYLGIVGTTGDFENLKGDVEVTDFTDVNRRERSLQLYRGDEENLSFHQYITFR
uniref:Jacalin-type lectin domain-containing protein n=1 Tax=Proboscia inermis TaxID=420281 RepID=A0A7S0GHM2_9STRA|mmetsp:Transcript_37495/g.37838  ORF Transcript_37495/g.37838 Transcript_37495/m.37838 type:complete len:195 (+) Transcript_37495:2-586(+)